MTLTDDQFHRLAAAVAGLSILLIELAAARRGATLADQAARSDEFARTTIALADVVRSLRELTKP